MTDGMLAFNAMYGANFLVDGQDPLREHTLLNGGSLYDFYETKDGGYLSVGSIEPQFFAAFCETIKCTELIPAGIEPPDIETVKKRVRDIIKTKTRDEWTEEFRKVDACVEPVLSLSEALNNSHSIERGMVVEVDLPNGGKVRQLASPIKFSETPPQYKNAGIVPRHSHKRGPPRNRLFRQRNRRVRKHGIVQLTPVILKSSPFKNFVKQEVSPPVI